MVGFFNNFLNVIWFGVMVFVMRSLFCKKGEFEYYCNFFYRNMRKNEYFGRKMMVRIIEVFVVY